MDAEIAQSNQRNFRRMVLSAKASYGALSLMVAICDNPRYRDELIESYEAELAAEGVDCLRVTIDRDEPSLKQSLMGLVNDDGSLDDRRCIVTALGGDQLLNVRLKVDKSAQERFAYSLQWTRESLREFKAPIVIWVNSSMATMISSQAKDFWSWRTGPFEFERAIEYQPIDRPQPFESPNYSDEPIADPAEIEQQIKVLLADDPESPLLRSLYQSLGIAYQERTEQGKAIDYAQEQQLGIEALKKAIELQEPLGETLNLANSLNSLAELYLSTGQYDRALPLHESALKIRKLELGDRHPDTAMSLNNLAALYASMGQYDRALPLHESALEIRKSELGDRHPDTAMSLNNLAALYSSTGQYDRALPLCESALEIRKSELGDRHPDTANSLNNLAALYASVGQYDRALPLYESALEIRKSELGDRHPSTAASLNNLAGLYSSMGQYDRSLPLYESALEIHKSELGDRHPDTATSLNNLALLYSSIGQYDRALPLYESALEICKSELGDRHPYTAVSLNNLAYFYYKTRHFEKAVTTISEAVKILQQALGNKHPNTILGQENLALFQKKLKETENLIEN